MLSKEDKFCLARAWAGLEPHPDVGASALVALMIKSLDGRIPTPEELELYRRVFSDDMIASVYQVDPNGPAPVRGGDVRMPSLPDGVELTEDQIEDGAKTGQWLDLWMRYAKRSAEMTDPLFLESGGLWLIGLAVARRIRLQLDFQVIYPNLYVLWVSPTTYYRKSTGLRVVERLARQILNKLLLPGQSSPEMLLAKLAGQLPSNYEDLDPEARAMEDAGRMFAGQRGFIADEMSKLFDKKYMQGLPEIIMELAESPAFLEQEYKGAGKQVVRDAYLSLLFATTPSRLQRVFGDGEWEDGLIARFGLLTPSQQIVERSHAERRGKKNLPDEVLVHGLTRLSANLPQPQMLDEAGVIPKLDCVDAAIDDEALARWNEYAGALHGLTRPDGELDYRLAGVYGRLPGHGLRVSLLLAAIDWAVQNKPSLPPRVTVAHWYRAQGIVETWRASSHRLLADVNRGEDQKVEDKILGALRKRQGAAPNKHRLWKLSGVSVRKEAYMCIDALVEAGVVQEVHSAGRIGYVMSEGGG